MLVLSRKANEGVSLGEHVYVYVLEVNGKRVKLGVKAPREVEVHRVEFDPDEEAGLLGVDYPP